MTMRNENGFVGALLLGVALGAVLAILYAPERGDKTRKKLSKKGGKLWDEASDQAEDLVKKGKKKIGV